MLITLSAFPNKVKETIDWLGLFLNKKAVSALFEVTNISGKIIQATFAGNPERTLISVYAPTNFKDNEEAAGELA